MPIFRIPHSSFLSLPQPSASSGRLSPHVGLVRPPFGLKDLALTAVFATIQLILPDPSSRLKAPSNTSQHQEFLGVIWHAKEAQGQSEVAEGRPEEIDERPKEAGGVISDTHNRLGHSRRLHLVKSFQLIVNGHHLKFHQNFTTQ